MFNSHNPAFSILYLTIKHTQLRLRTCLHSSELGSSPPSHHGQRVAHRLAAPHAKLAVHGRYLHNYMRPLDTPGMLLLLLLLLLVVPLLLLVVLLAMQRCQEGLNIPAVPVPRRPMVHARVATVVRVPTAVSVAVQVRAQVPRVPTDNNTAVRAGPNGHDRDAVVVLGAPADVHLSNLKVCRVAHGAARHVLVVLLFEAVGRPRRLRIVARLGGVKTATIKRANGSRNKKKGRGYGDFRVLCRDSLLRCGNNTSSIREVNITSSFN